MEKYPEEAIRNYLEEKRHLGKTTISNIEYLGGGNHHNYKVVTDNGTYVARVQRDDVIGSAARTKVDKEYALLKEIETYDVAPKAVYLDETGFERPVLIETFVDALMYSSIKDLTDTHLDVALELFLTVSKITVPPHLVEFRNTDYQKNVGSWHTRRDDIKEMAGDNEFIREFLPRAEELMEKAARVLAGRQDVLKKAPDCFVYNDIHGENLLYREQDRKAMCVDWQKVSYGDPSYMLAIFALAFRHRFGQDDEVFFDMLIERYRTRSNTEDLETLFWSRILEREVANMLYCIWVPLKRKRPISYERLEEYERPGRLQALLEHPRYRI